MSLLESLYKEYKELHSKMQKTGEMIILYGGKIPNTVGESANPLVIKTIPNNFAPDYPEHSSWKEKIIYIIEAEGRALSAMEVSKKIQEYEPHRDMQYCITIGTQYCSSLSRGDSAVLKATKVEGTNRNIYNVI